MYKKLIILSLFILTTVLSYSQESYYNDVNLNLTGINLKEELATKIISSHTRFLAYSQIWDASKVTDVNPNNNAKVLLIYGWENGSDSDVTNDRERGINQNSGNSGDWNREHVYSQSLGTPTLGDQGPGADAHHLRPADAQRNSSRNNRKFTAGSGNSGIQANSGWYPGDEWKGDVARMMMYMYVRYGERCLPTNIGIGSNSSTPDDMIDLFLQWNAEDPVSDIEKQRNAFHENTANEDAQGNRNPFIDNPRLATRIWGGPLAEDIWGIYSGSDSEAPSIPTNLSANNITTFSVDLSWDAATDNVSVTSYDIYMDGNLVQNTTNTSITISNLESNTNYSFTVTAKDIVNNTSAQSTAINVQIIEDVEAPSIPNNIVISNQTTTSFIVSWDASTDNTAVTEYDVYLDDNKIASTTETMYTVTDLSINTTYSIQISAKDKVGNVSDLSTSVEATTNGNNTTSTEIFFSEYVEGSSHNKALEIVNLTPNNIDLSIYSIKRQQNAGKDGHEWDHTLTLSGILNANDVYVIINDKADLQTLIDEADLAHPNISSNNWGAPISFNGNDPVGLFKNDVLIDIIGVYNEGGTNFAKDKTIRRKNGILQPNTSFDINNEWDVYSKDTVDDIGKHSAIVLSTKDYSFNSVEFYPNPINDILTIKNPLNKEIQNITLYNLLGKKVFQQKNPKKNINLNKISKGIYIITLEIDNKFYKSRIIKN